MWSKDLEGADIAVLPTGAGKSLIISEFVRRLNQPVLILQPSREILSQNKEKLENYVDKSEIGVYSASFNSKDIKTYTLATIGSVFRKPELFSHFKVVICDECDLIPVKKLGSMFMKFFNKMGSPKIIGTTATPFRLDTQYERLNDFFVLTHTVTKMINRMGTTRFWHRIVFNITTQELIDQGYLVPFKYYNVNLKAKIPVNKSKSDFDLEKYSQLIQGDEPTIIKLVLTSQVKFKSVLVFCASVDQAKRLSEQVKGSEVVSSETKKKDRTRIIEGFKDGSIKTVFNFGVLTVGFDSPRLDCIILCRPSQSIRLYSQMLGRGSRISPGKTHCTVIDTTSTVKKLGRLETIRVEKLDTGWDIVTETGNYHGKILYSFKIDTSTS
jgi:DNA repair protein RadD